MLKLTKYVLYDILNNKIISAFALFLLLVSITLFQLEENQSKAVMSLMTIILFVLPLVSMVFATIHYYNSYEFMELMLAQPISRTKILVSEYLGVSLSLLSAFLMGVGIPVFIYSFNQIGFTVIFAGSILVFIFTSLAFLSSVLARDKARGIGLVLLVWLFFSLVYDGALMLLIFALSDYPIEKFTIALASLNPIDLARIFIMLKMDISALMGYTGAVYKKFFGGYFGSLYTVVILLIWAIVPFLISLRAFKRKDL